MAKPGLAKSIPPAPAQSQREPTNKQAVPAIGNPFNNALDAAKSRSHYCRFGVCGRVLYYEHFQQAAQ